MHIRARSKYGEVEHTVENPLHAHGSTEWVGGGNSQDVTLLSQCHTM